MADNPYKEVCERLMMSLEGLDKAALNEIMDDLASAYLRNKLGCDPVEEFTRLREQEDMFPGRTTYQTFRDYNIFLLSEGGYNVELVDVGTGELRLTPYPEGYLDL